MHYLSRAFVEFGPFPSAEIHSFHQRGLLQETDYIRDEDSQEWLHVSEWVLLSPTAKPQKRPAAKKPKPMPTPAAKKTAVKKAKKAA